MWVIVYANEGWDQGLVYLCRELSDDETMDERRFADEIAAQYDREIADPDGYIPNCCGDLRVEFMEHKPACETRDGDTRFLGATCIWSGESFYFKREER